MLDWDILSRKSQDSPGTVSAGGSPLRKRGENLVLVTQECFDLGVWVLDVCFGNPLFWRSLGLSRILG